MNFTTEKNKSDTKCVSDGCSPPLLQEIDTAAVEVNTKSRARDEGTMWHEIMASCPT